MTARLHLRPWGPIDFALSDADPVRVYQMSLKLLSSGVHASVGCGQVSTRPVLRGSAVGHDSCQSLRNRVS